MDQVQESACLSRCVGETRLTINKASNLVQSLRQFQKTVNFDAAPQVLSGLQLSGSTSAPRFISFPLACCAGGQRKSPGGLIDPILTRRGASERLPRAENRCAVRLQF